MFFFMIPTHIFLSQKTLSQQFLGASHLLSVESQILHDAPHVVGLTWVDYSDGDVQKEQNNAFMLRSLL